MGRFSGRESVTHLKQTKQRHLYVLRLPNLALLGLPAFTLAQPATGTPEHKKSDRLSSQTCQGLPIVIGIKAEVLTMSSKAPPTRVPLNSTPASLLFAYSAPLLASIVPETCHMLSASGPLPRLRLCLESSLLNSQVDNFLISFKQLLTCHLFNLVFSAHPT